MTHFAPFNFITNDHLECITFKNVDERCHLWLDDALRTLSSQILHTIIIDLKDDATVDRLLLERKDFLGIDIGRIALDLTALRRVHIRYRTNDTSKDWVRVGTIFNATCSNIDGRVPLLQVDVYEPRKSDAGALITVPVSHMEHWRKSRTGRNFAYLPS